MKLFRLITLASVLMVSCSSKSKETGLKGTLQNSSGEKVVLEELSTNTVIPHDSATVASDGSFNLKNPATTAGFYRLRIGPTENVILILDKGQKPEITADAKNIANTVKVKGSPDSEQLFELNSYLRKNFMKRDSLQKVYQSYQNSPARDSIGRVLEADFNKTMEQQREYIRNFVSKNSSSLVALAAIEQLSPDTDLEYFKMVDQALTKKYPVSPYVTSFHAKVAELGKLNTGSDAPEIALPNPEGQEVKLSSLRGKVVLIDFWASWCGPCRKENPNVVKLYNQYKNKGFEIFSVSLDKDKQAWIKAIEQDKLTWTHVSDLQFWNSKAAKEYNVTGIPQTFLLDKDGKIIAKGLRGEPLAAKLAEILK